MPVAEHHDGFAMYDTDYNRWNAARMGPCRDIVSELAESVRERGMHFALSSHREEHCWFFNSGMTIPSDVQDDAFRDLYGPCLTRSVKEDDAMKDEVLDDEWLSDWLVRTCELVDKFKPEVVFFDWWIEEACYAKHLLKFAAYYYNRCHEWGIQGAINYKNEAMPQFAGIFDVERGQLSGIRPLFWQTDTSVAYNSWSYVEGMQYRSPASIIHDFIDIVSKNGALLLNIGPRADGTIPDEQQHLLRELGAWLKVNGEAIRGTNPWKIFGEGPTEVKEGMFAESNRQDFTAEDIRFTTKAGNIYAHVLSWPESGTLTIKNFYENRRFCPLGIHQVEMLGRDGALEFSRDLEGMHVILPQGERPCRHAWVLKLTPA
jgi:alpha-L-fucosidase